MKSDNQIAYDANFAVNKHRGMGKYINNFVGVLEKEIGVDTLGLLKKHTKDVSSGKYYSFGLSNYIFWEQISLLKFSRKFHGSIIFPYNTAPLFLGKSTRHILIVHDLIFFNSFKTRSLKQKVGVLYRRFVLPRIINKFKCIITVSEYSKGILLSHFDLNSDKIKVIPNSIEFSTEQIELNPTYGQRHNYILHIGGEPSYKNSKALLHAFYLLPEAIKQIYKVKILGIRDAQVLQEFRSLSNDLGIADRIEFLAYQTDHEVEVLYKNAKMLVFPSFDEGFGIPIIESFKYGCPLLCSRISCFSEIAGEGARYFDPNDYNSISSAIMDTINKVEQTKLNIKIGYKQLQFFSLEVFSAKVKQWYDENMTN